MKPEQRISRTTAWIDREFGREKWPAISARIDGEIAAGETDLARVVSRVKRWELHTERTSPAPITVDGVRLEVPWAFGVHGGLAMQIEMLIDAARGADAIVELGSGWGYNLFQMWLAGGERRAKYYALEFTQTGRDATAALARLEPRLDLAVLPFDYYAVDLDAIGTFPGRVFAFSIFSVDQIPQLSRDVFDALRRLAPQVDGMHFEPAGWQMPERRGARGGSSAQYAERHDYNRNLWPLIAGLERDGLLHVDETRPELFGLNADNSATLIRWSARRSD